ncbi:hypothetical protein D878_gp24 [Sulfolobales Mexican rudivirus 1]|jgi:hypothetical protein|uniref:Uncharacterized protein n=1 Tax=Sulfolobales Mexican rod-shaped virus 1 TaxID=2848122 RepID=K4NX84_9VIRU|nr:hypothetical protein D878_gp24 [Sulfolobales Mexican rudivirus 1]AFV51251.1 hypothetical protein [Sulfolobales Mexican rod-shaped virus 1]
MHNGAQKRVIKLINVIRRRYKPPAVRTWIFHYIWHGRSYTIATIAVRLTGDGALHVRKKIEARLKALEGVNVTTFLDGEYIKYTLEA